MSISIDNTNKPVRSRRWSPLAYGLAAAAVILLMVLAAFVNCGEKAGQAIHGIPFADSNVCPQPLAIVPNSHFKNSSQFLEPAYVNKSAELVSGAIQIPTVSYDGMDLDVHKEKRFKIFKILHRYLNHKFPLMAEKLEYVNTYGLLYTVEGKDSSLKPLVLMAHQDVVPVNPDTEDQWEHPPFSGYFDGTWLYGRGTCDTKQSLIGWLEAAENLLHQGWHPERTVLFSFGFDEEVEGTRGAGHLSSTIEERYGKDSVELIVDEGAGIAVEENLLLALPAVAEKGMLDLEYTVHTPGGHSSIPPDHTGIGVAAKLVTAFEANPFQSHLEAGSINSQFFGCIGKYSPGIDDHVREIFTNLDTKKNRAAAIKIIDQNRELRYLLRTSQAADIIAGGVKVNALPEKVKLLVNHRVSVDESLDFVIERSLNLAKPIAKSFGLGLTFEGKTLVSGDKGTIAVRINDQTQIAPKSPTSGPHWDLIAGTNKYVFDDVLGGEYGSIVTAPLIMVGNTDTANYWNLTNSIYRFTPLLEQDVANVHTVNEKLRFRSHINTVVWSYDFLLAAS